MNSTSNARLFCRAAKPGLCVLLLASTLPSIVSAQTCLQNTPTPIAEKWTASTTTVKGEKITIWTGPTDHGSSLAIASGIEKSLWVTLTSDAAIMKMSTEGAAEIYATPTPNSSPEAIVANGTAMWFSEWATGCVGEVTAGGKIIEYPAGFSPTNSVGMTAADGDAWFDTDHNGIGKITSAGKVTVYNLRDNNSQPTGITKGPDGNVWFIENQGSNIGKITPAGVPTEYDVGSGVFTGSFGIAAGADGRIWFADPGNSPPQIGAINTDGSGLTYYRKGLTGQADSIVAAPDGNLYFGEYGAAAAGGGGYAAAIGRITTSGVITEFPLPTLEGDFPVLSLTVGPDGNVWFSNNSHSQIGTLTIAGGPVVTLAPSSVKFPTTEVGYTSEAQVVALTNTGTGSLTITSVAITGTDLTSFIDFSNCGASLAAGKSCSVVVGFAPTKVGALAAKLTITDNAAGSPQTVTLAGSGGSIPSLTLSPSSVSFPATLVGAAAPDQAVTVTNSSSTTAAIDSIALSGADPKDFGVLSTCGATLGAKASCTIYVEFAPKTAGALTANVTLTDDAAGSPQAIKLNGTGK